MGENFVPPTDDLHFDLSWVFPALRYPPCGGFLWNAASNFTMCTVGTIARILVHWLNRTRCYNFSTLDYLIQRRPADIPLLTVSNHVSRFDDPGMWGGLGYRVYLGPSRMRWSMAAHDICFTNKLHSYFFLLGRVIPVIRGRGVYQEAVNFCIEQLEKGGWVHIFPEGRINEGGEVIRFKWGVGRMIYESSVTPIVVPIWLVGLDNVIPIDPPFIPKFGQKVTFNFGNPIDLADLLRDLRRANTSAEEARRIITERIQIEMMKLKEETEALHYMRDVR